VSPPAHTIAEVGLIGGGQVPRPGEGFLAHHGMRLRDELPKCRRHVLEVLRQPLEESVTTIQSPAHAIDVFALTALAARVKPSPAVATLQEDRRKILWPQSDEAPRVVTATTNSADTAAPPVDTDRR
jgi:predicted ATPase with chaperone activity